MITKELLQRINQLARRKREHGLTKEEAAEQKELYRIYLSAIRAQFTSLLDTIEVVDQEALPQRPVDIMRPTYDLQNVSFSLLDGSR